MLDVVNDAQRQRLHRPGAGSLAKLVQFPMPWLGFNVICRPRGANAAAALAIWRHMFVGGAAPVRQIWGVIWSDGPAYLFQGSI